MYSRLTLAGVMGLRVIPQAENPGFADSANAFAGSSYTPRALATTVHWRDCSILEKSLAPAC